MGRQVHRLTEELKETQRTATVRKGEQAGVQAYLTCVKIHLTTLILCLLVKNERKKEL